MGVQMPPNIDLGILVILCVQDPFVPPKKIGTFSKRKTGNEVCIAAKLWIFMDQASKVTRQRWYSMALKPMVGYIFNIV